METQSIEEFRDVFFKKLSPEINQAAYIAVCIIWDKTCDELFGKEQKIDDSMTLPEIP